MQVKSIAECSKHSAILSTFIKIPFVLKTFALSVLCGCVRRVLLYITLMCFFQSLVSQGFVFMMVVTIALSVMKTMNTTFPLELYITGTFGNIKVIFPLIFHFFG